MAGAGLEMFLNAYSLIAHPATPPFAVQGVSCSLSLQDAGQWTISFSVDCDEGDLALPQAQPPARRDGLWQATCFELFMKNDADGSYCEFNFAPSGQWAAYAFDGYRAGMRDLEIRELCILTSQREQFLLASAHFYPELPMEAHLHLADSEFGPNFSLSATLEDRGFAEQWGAKPLSLAISAVIEEADGTKSYWAMVHGDGPPDFHHADCFAQKVAAPDAA